MNDPKEVAKQLASRLIERGDAKAKQVGAGNYVPDRERCVNRCGECEKCQTLVPWGLSDVIDHVNGKASYGHYLVDPNGNTCRTFIFDIDLRKKARPERDEPPIMFDGEEIDPRDVWNGPVNPARLDLGLQLRAMAQGLGEHARRLLGIPVLATYSGNKGMHVYGCLDRGTSAAEARELARGVLDTAPGPMVEDVGENFFKHEHSFPALQVELFPKQDTVAPGGFGNLARLPLGIHRKSNRPSFFVDFSDPVKMKIDDPLRALTEGTFK